MTHQEWNLRHYNSLAAKAAELGLPKSYQTDLTKHDFQALEQRDARKPFGWALHESGTQLMFDAEFVRQVGRVRRGEQTRWFYWSGTQLTEVASAELLAEELTVTCSVCGAEFTEGPCRACARAELDAWKRNLREKTR